MIAPRSPYNKHDVIIEKLHVTGKLENILENYLLSTS